MDAQRQEGVCVSQAMVWTVRIRALRTRAVADRTLGGFGSCVDAEAIAERE
jgi:hypothetical protein